jgi:addiction module HigA family antidote
VNNALTSGLRPIHPGEILREDVLPYLGMKDTEIALRLGISRQTLDEILHCERPITAWRAERIGKLTNTTPESWIRMQQNYDLNHGKSA